MLGSKFSGLGANCVVPDADFFSRIAALYAAAFQARQKLPSDRVSDRQHCQVSGHAVSSLFVNPTSPDGLRRSYVRRDGGLKSSAKSLCNATIFFFFRPLAPAPALFPLGPEMILDVLAMHQPVASVIP